MWPCVRNSILRASDLSEKVTRNKRRSFRFLKSRSPVFFEKDNRIERRGRGDYGGTRARREVPCKCGRRCIHILRNCISSIQFVYPNRCLFEREWAQVRRSEGGSAVMLLHAFLVFASGPLATKSSSSSGGQL